jgi:nucleotide-binding universal stress UspA family protein
MTTLVVATDGSDLAIQAALSGLSLTRPADKVLIVSVLDLVDPMEGAGGHAGPLMSQDEVEGSHRESESQGEAAVAATSNAIQAAGYTPRQIETLLVEGHPPGPTLCGLAAEVRGVALIIGSRGRGGLKRALLGSVSDHVVRNAPCTVIVSRGTE